VSSASCLHRKRRADANSVLLGGTAFILPYGLLSASLQIAHQFSYTRTVKTVGLRWATELHQTRR